MAQEPVDSGVGDGLGHQLVNRPELVPRGSAGPSADIRGGLGPEGRPRTADNEEEQRGRVAGDGTEGQQGHDDRADVVGEVEKARPIERRPDHQ